MAEQPNIASEFNLSQDQVTDRILNDFGDAIKFYTEAFQRLANDKRIHPNLRNYAKQTIIGASSILGG